VDFLSLLDENGFSGRGLKIFSEDGSALSDDGGCFVMFKDLLFEFLILFGSVVVEFNDVCFQTGELLLLHSDDARVDLSSWVKITFEFSLKSDSLLVGVSKVGIVCLNVDIATHLIISVGSVVLLLFSDVSVLKIGQGGEELVQRIASLQLKVDGVKDGSSEPALVNSLDNSLNVHFGSNHCTNEKQCN
jgi:hypothetical protein